MDIGGWLRGLGLEQYQAAFRENQIGVAIVGHRRKMLSAIAELSGLSAATALALRRTGEDGVLAVHYCAHRICAIDLNEADNEVCGLVGATATATRLSVMETSPSFL